jgi:hypothetical protein
LRPNQQEKSHADLLAKLFAFYSTFANGGKELSRKLHNESATKEMEVFDFAKSRKNMMSIGYQG